MSKAGIIVLLGLLTAFMPFIGIPLAVKTPLTIALGLLTLVLGFLVREERRWLLRALRGDRQPDAYTESGAEQYGKEIPDA